MSRCVYNINLIYNKLSSTKSKVAVVLKPIEMSAWVQTQSSEADVLKQEILSQSRVSWDDVGPSTYPRRMVWNKWDRSWEKKGGGERQAQR